MNEVFPATRAATISSYNKFCHFHDIKASALPSKKHQFCLLLNPRLTTVSDPIGKSLTKWLPLYRVETVLTTSNYIIRKVGKNNTQCIHRIPLLPIKPQYVVADLPVIHSINSIPHYKSLFRTYFFFTLVIFKFHVRTLDLLYLNPINDLLPFVSRIPRPLTPTPRGFSSPHFVPSSTPAHSLQGFQTSTLIHSQPQSSVNSPSQGL